MKNLSIEKLAKYIDHTVLKPTAVYEDVKQLCSEAAEYKFASVCVNPCFIELCAEMLKESGVKVCTVIGFPLGANTAEIKAAEAAQAVQLGAEEVDMVINIDAAKSGDWERVEADIRAVVEAVPAGICVKVILETCYLDKDEIIRACKAAQAAGACFVKTSTGFGTGGATVEDVKLMSETVGDRMKVKASGGVRSYKDAVAMIEVGADRLGTSAGIAIIKGAE
ncbi:deoxyribose-phosphate aldolase [Lentisphaerota bacterium ZTH]|nr:deoxyribose-phosphate aldolase [Lentisphaerota bacterium]WET07151.1 deoxyribose-phosphate aldolase [Lentisphaerota bacterium ZTH]